MMNETVRAALAAQIERRRVDVAKFRETLGQTVREAWVDWAKARRAEGHEVPDHHLEPWERLAEHHKEVDRQIGVAVAGLAYSEFAHVLLRIPDDARRVQRALGLGDLQEYSIEAIVAAIEDLRRRAGLPVIPEESPLDRMEALAPAPPPPPLPEGLTANEVMVLNDLAGFYPQALQAALDAGELPPAAAAYARSRLTPR